MKGLKCTSYQLGYELTAVCGRAMKWCRVDRFFLPTNISKIKYL